MSLLTRYLLSLAFGIVCAAYADTGPADDIKARELGGLTFGRKGNGKVATDGHLSFDQYGLAVN